MTTYKKLNQCFTNSYTVKNISFLNVLFSITFRASEKCCLVCLKVLNFLFDNTFRASEKCCLVFKIVVCLTVIVEREAIKISYNTS